MDKKKIESAEYSITKSHYRYIPHHNLVFHRYLKNVTNEAKTTSNNNKTEDKIEIDELANSSSFIANPSFVSKHHTATVTA